MYSYLAHNMFIYIDRQYSPENIQNTLKLIVKLALCVFPSPHRTNLCSNARYLSLRSGLVVTMGPEQRDKERRRRGAEYLDFTLLRQYKRVCKCSSKLEFYLHLL